MSAREELATELAAAEAELLDWTAGGHSHWNSVHDSVTGNAPGTMYVLSAQADAAEVERLTNKVKGLRLLMEGTPAAAVNLVGKPSLSYAEQAAALVAAANALRDHRSDPTREAAPLVMPWIVHGLRDQGYEIVKRITT